MFCYSEAYVHDKSHFGGMYVPSARIHKYLLDLYKATGIPPEAVIENEYIPAVELNCQL